MANRVPEPLLLACVQFDSKNLLPEANRISETSAPINLYFLLHEISCRAFSRAVDSSIRPASNMRNRLSTSRVLIPDASPAWYV